MNNLVFILPSDNTVLYHLNQQLVNSEFTFFKKIKKFKITIDNGMISDIIDNEVRLQINKIKGDNKYEKNVLQKLWTI
jgi:hypothetical protein